MPQMIQGLCRLVTTCGVTTSSAARTRPGPSSLEQVGTTTPCDAARPRTRYLSAGDTWIQARVPSSIRVTPGHVTNRRAHRYTTMNGDRCLSNGWSIITSASTNSHLAGLLAGFVFMSIISLFGRPGPKNTRTLGLLCAAFVVLGFSSHLFGTVGGGAADPWCERVWSEGITASGMLVVGAVALVSAIGWLMASHLDAVNENTGTPTSDSRSDRPLDLGRLSRVMVRGVAVGVTLLLGITTSDYLDVMAGGGTPRVLALLVDGLPVVALVVLLGWSRARRLGSHKNAKDVTREHAPTPSLMVATLGTLGYGLFGPVFAGALIHLPDNVWKPASLTITIAGATVGLLFPAALVAILAHALPRASTSQASQPELPARPRTEGPDHSPVRPPDILTTRRTTHKINWSG